MPIGYRFRMQTQSTEASTKLGLPPGETFTLGVLLLIYTTLYAIPRTAVLGAVRVGDPLLIHALFPVYLGIALWAGLYLRDARVRALMPLQTNFKMEKS